MINTEQLPIITTIPPDLLSEENKTISFFTYGILMNIQEMELPHIELVKHTHEYTYIDNFTINPVYGNYFTAVHHNNKKLWGIKHTFTGRPQDIIRIIDLFDNIERVKEGFYCRENIEDDYYIYICYHGHTRYIKDSTVWYEDFHRRHGNHEFADFLRGFASPRKRRKNGKNTRLG